MMTTIQDVVTYADGSIAVGKIILTWSPFSYLGTAIAAGQQTYPIAPDGSIAITCFPSVGVPGAFYTATYQLDKGAVYDEYWAVPATNAPITIGTVRVLVPAKGV